MLHGHTRPHTAPGAVHAERTCTHSALARRHAHGRTHSRSLQVIVMAHAHWLQVIAMAHAHWLQAPYVEQAGRDPFLRDEPVYCTVMADIVMDYMIMADIVTAYVIVARSRGEPVYCTVMADMVMVYMVMAYIVMAHVVLARAISPGRACVLCSYGLCSYGLCSHGLCSNGLNSHGEDHFSGTSLNTIELWPI